MTYLAQVIEAEPRRDWPDEKLVRKPVGYSHSVALAAERTLPENAGLFYIEMTHS